VTVPNVGFGFRPFALPPSGLPPHQAFMALESSWSLAVNIGSDGDLGRNWVLLNKSSHAIGPNAGEAGGCPSARWGGDGFYYVMGGGNYVDVVRSPNLTYGSWTLSPLGHVEQ
jgi:hypothetical protein